MTTATITRCSVTIRDDGTLLYEAGVELDEGQEPVEVEWFINGELAARDGPLSAGDSFESNFQQPREDGFTGNETLEFPTLESVRQRFGAGKHTVTVAPAIVASL